MPPAAALMDELGEDPFLRLSPELVEEVFFRLPPNEPTCLVRASAVCKPWRRILADLGFRRRYRRFHGTPPVLGLFQQGDWLFRKGSRFVPTSALFPAQRDRPYWFAMDCRHGRALLVQLGLTPDLVVLDPMTDHQRLVPSPSIHPVSFSAAVLCAGAAQGCDHHGCQGGHFHLAVVSTEQAGAISAWLYSSETAEWAQSTTALYHSNALLQPLSLPSVLVGDALYFNIGYIVECQLGTLRMSMFEKPIDGKGRLMTAEDGGLGFAAVVDVTNLTIWSMEAGPEGATGWAKLRVIDLKALLPDGALLIPSPEDGIAGIAEVIQIAGIAEGTQVIFVSTCVGSYMVDLKSRQVKKVSRPGKIILPYMSFYLPAMEAASTGQGR